MTGVREYFSSYKEEQMNFQITMGNSTKCTPVGRGAIVFQMEAKSSVKVTNALHVPRLAMNLISVSQLQDKGYDIHFIGKKVYVKHASWKQTRQIGVRSNRLYRLHLESPMALISSSLDDKKGLNELWHRRMGHLHHDALKTVKETVDGAPILNTKNDDVCRDVYLGSTLRHPLPEVKTEQQAY